MGGTRTTMAEGEDLGGVGEGDGAFAWGVEGGEHEDEQGDEAEVGAALLWNVKGEPSGKKGPSHLGEGKEEQCAAAVGVDGEEGGDGEDEVDGTEAEGCKECFDCAGAG